jgi:hypothetical protein
MCQLLQRANVKVSDPEVDSAKGFYTYLITGSDDKGSFEMRRRYNDFFYFREALTKQWPGVYIPPIPEKKIAVKYLPFRATKTPKTLSAGNDFSIFS